MPDAIITSTASTFGTISGTFAADQSTVTGTVTGIVAGTLSGSVGVPGPAGPGVPAGGTAGQYLQKIDGVDYNTDWVTLNLSGYAPLASPAFTGNPTAPTAALGDNDTSLATTAFVQQELLSGTANAKNLEVYVRNQTGSTLAAGAIVYINGATGNRPTVTLAQANNDANSAQTMGFVKTAIANNGFGYVIVRGEIEGLDTQAVAEGTQLYLSPTTAGAYTTTKPSAPQHLVYVGIVIRSHPTQGVILVAVQNGYELNELHDVSITSPTNGQVLKYNSTTGLWYNGTDSAGVAWGGITGTLSSQTDLQTALDGKYSTTNPAGYITSSALTGYATETFVTSQGYITSAALSPYLTSATAASTYQTLSGMSSYLTTSAAASTYQTLSGMSSYLTTSTAASTYALKTNGELKGNFTLDGTTASPNSDGSILIGSLSSGYSYLYLSAGDIKGRTFSGTNSSFTLDATSGLQLFSSGQGVRFPDASVQTVAYPGPSGFLLKADNLSGLANTGTARTNLGLGTMATETASNYLTTATAASTYFTIASAANKADLASPTFTGTPTLPTGTIAVTQSAGNNTTAVATTAFVQTSNPDASTTTKGHVELATLAEASTSSSTSLVAPLSAVPGLLTRPELRSLAAINRTAVSGSGAVSANSGFSYSREMFLNSLAIGRASFSYGLPGVVGFGSSLANRFQVDFSKKIWMSGNVSFGLSGSPNYLGDSNTMCRITLGGYSSETTGDMTLRGIGLKKVGGVSSVVTLTVHNGTALTDVATTNTVADNATINWIIYSDGTGNVTLYINGVQAATTTAGPTSATGNHAGCYREQVEATTTPGVRQLMTIGAGGGWLYLEA